MDKKKINFKISKQNDVFAFFELINQSDNYKKELLSFIGLDDDRATKETVSSLINEIYKKEKGLTKDDIEKIEKTWESKYSFFINGSREIFKDIYVFHDGITASPSVLPFFGRFFEKQLITFPYNKGVDEAIFVIVHEYLHFIFYKYIYEKFKLTSKEMSSQKVWDFSEAINVVIQNQKSWIEIFKVKAKPYPQHVALYDNLLKDWNKEKSIDYLVQKFIIEKK